MSIMTPARFRDRFPMLEKSVHLASCSQGARSIELDESLDKMMNSMTEEGAPWGIWMGEVENARALFAAYINASVEEIAIVPNASVGAFQVASTMDYSSRRGVVTTDMEFPSIAHVWLAQRPHGAVVTYAPENDGYVEVSEYVKLIDSQTNLVSIPMVSYKNGARLPVSEIVDHAHKSGARVFVDAYQAAGVVPIDVQSLKCDYLVAGTLKYMLGIPGVAFLYVRNGVADQIDPQLTGWFGRVNPFAFDPRNIDFPIDARRMETGTPSIPSIYGANAGLSLLNLLDPEVAWKHVRGLVRKTADLLGGMGYALYLPRDESRWGPQVAVHSSDPDKMSALLKEHNIFSSPRGEVVRLSFHYYNTDSDVESCARAFSEYQSI